MEKRIDFISFEEFQKMYKSEKRKEFKILMALAFGSGLRISEILGLARRVSRCCEVDVGVKSVKEIGRRKKHYFCSRCNKELDYHKDIKNKNGEWKIKPLTADMINLQEHKINLNLAKGGKWRTTVTPPMFREGDLKYLPLKLKRRNVEYHIAKLSKEVLGKKISPHTFRHGFGNYHANVIKTPLDRKSVV